MDLFSGADKQAMESIMDDIHDTFSRSIFLIKEAEKTVVITNPNEFISSYGHEQPSVETSKVQVSGQYEARIKYINKAELSFVTEGKGGEDINRLSLLQTKNQVRLKLPMSALPYFNDTKQVQFDSGHFKPLSSPKLHGIFSPKYFDVFLEEVE